MKLAVVGANGRMGRAVVRLAHEAGMSVVCAIGTGDIGKDAGDLAGIGPIGSLVSNDLETLRAAKPDALVDFSAPAALARASAIAAEVGIAIASGTTGLDAAANAGLEAATHKVPVLWEPNMSIGVHVLSKLVANAVAALGAAYDVEILEAHHRMKVDAPSGTALRLAAVAKEARRADTRFVYGREGRPGARATDELAVLAMRGGDVIGDHTVFLLGDGERLELTHRATSRDLFARGALRAAAWLVGRPAGRYALDDVLST